MNYKFSPSPNTLVPSAQIGLQKVKFSLIQYTPICDGVGRGADMSQKKLQAAAAVVKRRVLKNQHKAEREADPVKLKIYCLTGFQPSWDKMISQIYRPSPTKDVT
jgi:hypothetical protein